MPLLEQVAAKLNCVHAALEPNPIAQQLLDEFFARAHLKSELDRIALARNLYIRWQQSRLPLTLFPGVPEREDWWFLIQVYALQKQVKANGYQAIFKFNTDYQLAIDWQPTSREVFAFASPLWKLVWGFSPQLKPAPMPREQIDRVISQVGDQVLRELDVDPKVYEIRHIQFDELLRLASQLEIGRDKRLVHLAGYRKRMSGELDGLIAGNFLFGGSRFIDSWWQTTLHTNVWPCLVISQR